MLPLLSSSEMQAVDHAATHEFGLPEILLMEHAALAAVDALKQRFQSLLPTTRGVLLVGPGNNGGDALATARLLHEAGVSALFVVLPETTATQLSAAAAQQLSILGKLGIPWAHSIDRNSLASVDWIIDGFFGTGLSRELRDPYLSLLNLVNEFAGRKWVISLDLPSGLSADTGNPLGNAIRASETIALGYIKKGLVTAQAAEYVGKLRLAPIQIPRTIPLTTDTFLYTKEDARRLPGRLQSGHKGDYGHVWIWAGEANHEGASLISAVGALHSGVGLVSLLGSRTDLQSLRSRAAIEIMVEEFSANWTAASAKTAVVVGPGMGVSKASAEALRSLLSTNAPLVLDADAVNTLAQNPSLFKPKLKARAEEGKATLLTPHPKEAARLLDTTTAAIEADRYSAARALSRQWSAHVLLKGKGSVVALLEGPLIVVTQGNSALSKGGTGDLLAGILGGLLAQSVQAAHALPLAAYLHGRAAELQSAAIGTERSATASEIAGFLGKALAELEAC